MYLRVSNHNLIRLRYMHARTYSYTLQLQADYEVHNTAFAKYAIHIKRELKSKWAWFSFFTWPKIKKVNVSNENQV